MVKNVELERRFEASVTFHQESHQDEGTGSNSDTDNSPVPSSTFSDFNDASSKAETESLPAWTSSWSSPTDAVNTARIADPQGDVHPDWIVPSSPPSPPLQYDPRCRASSPDTPSPLYAKWQKPSSRAEAGKPLFARKPSTANANSRSSSQIQSVSSANASAPVSRASSWLSSSDYASSSTSAISEEPSNSIFIHAPFVGGIVPLHSSIQPRIHASYQQPAAYQSQPLASTSSAPAASQYAPIPRTGGQSYSTAVGARARPGLAKLSRFREPTSSGKKRVILPAKHAHKRSCSVQWQQSERWQKKSRARLRDLLILLLLMLVGTLAIWRTCFNKTKSSSNSRRQAFILPHLATLPEPQRDTMVIYRILGNDLPPRHEIGQTLRNLRFMLSHENDFSHFSSPNFTPYNLKIDKYYVLNRITNATTVDTILSMFEEYGVPQNRVLNIPFDLDEYRKQEMRWDSGVAVGKNLWGIGQPGGMENITAAVDYYADSVVPETLERKEKRLKRDLMTKLRAMEYATHDKNLYAINNNGGRNFALEHGRSLPNARWIFPLDGNCFLTPPAMAAMVQTMATEAEGDGSKRHVIVPMARLLDNQHVLLDNEAPWKSDDVRLQDLEIDHADAPEEPQVGFRWDSPVSYQPSMRYGRRSKLELLWRLGAIPFARGLHIKRLPWEKQDHLYITPHSYASAVTTSVQQEQTTSGISDGDFTKAGWVHRLFSGDTSQEHSTTRAAELRRVNRMRGIVSCLESLDIKARIHALNNSQVASPARLWQWNTRDVSRLKSDMSRKHIASTSVERYARASTDLKHRLSNNLRFAEGADLSATWAHDTCNDALRLALAGYLTDNAQHTQIALKALMAVLPMPSISAYQTTLALGQPPIGYAFPTLPHSLSDTRHSVALPYNPFTFDITPILDIMKLVRMSGHDFSKTPAQQKWLREMEDVFMRHLRILLLSDDSLAISQAPRSVGLAVKYDSAVASLSAHLHLPSLLSRVQSRHRLRFIDPATGILNENIIINVQNEALYNAFTNGLNNVALESSTPESVSDTHRILDELVLSM